MEELRTRLDATERRLQEASEILQAQIAEPKRVLLNARRIYREGKGTDRKLLAFEDITDQKQTEEALKSSETRYRRLFETAQDGIG